MSSFGSILIANRGEIAVRIARAATELGIEVVAVHSSDEPNAAHLRAADRALGLPGRGVAAYLDIAALVAVAVEAGCEAVHPGYGFLSENVDFARACHDAGLTFIGPSPEQLALFGDKAAARRLAAELGVPLLAGSDEAITLEGARDFLAGLGEGGAIMLKAVSGGGGRGMRIVETDAALDAAFEACAAEAAKAFGNPDLYAEIYIRKARHIEVQIVGDGTGAIVHLGERECSLQRRHQKLVEIAPSPGLTQELRNRLTGVACRMAAKLRYKSLCTFEFLVDADDGETFWFIEANPRVQVEHTVTEELFGVDLVQWQIAIAEGRSLADLGIDQDRLIDPQGMAMQLRINAERFAGQGVEAAAGTLRSCEMPAGPGVRVDGYLRGGDRVSPSYDTLLGKIIVRQAGAPGPGCYQRLLDRADRALRECRIAGVETNRHFLAALVELPQVRDDLVYTRLVEDKWNLLREDAEARAGAGEEASLTPHEAAPAAGIVIPDGTETVLASGAGMLVRFCVEPGDSIMACEALAILEAMKMEAPVEAPVSGIVHSLAVAEGAIVAAGDIVAFLSPGNIGERDGPEEHLLDLETMPPLLAEEIARREARLDAARPDAVEARHRISRRTIRENIEALCDGGSFVEYGGTRRRVRRGTRRDQRRPVSGFRKRLHRDGL